MIVCREYNGPRLPAGYGHPTFAGEQVLLHRWIAEQVDGPLAPGEEVMHTCDNPPCFLYEHLRRGTHGDNMRDKVAKGRVGNVSRPGEQNGRARLSADDVRDIHRLSRAGVPTREIAGRFGLVHTYTCNILAGVTWPAIKAEFAAGGEHHG